MVSKWEDDQSLEVTQQGQDVGYVVEGQGQEGELGYSALLSNQPSDVLDMLDDSGSETQYMDGQYGQGESGTVA